VSVSETGVTETATRPRVEPPAPAPAHGPARWSDWYARQAAVIAVYLASIAAALIVATLLILAVGGSPGSVASSLWRGSFGSRDAMSETINQTTPLLIVGLGTVVAFRAGIVNIGQEGQFIIGALTGAAIGTKVAGPGGPLMIVAVLAAAAAGGAVWALLPAVLVYWRGIHETVTTLLLNLVAYQVVSLAVNRQYLLQMSGRQGTGNLAPQSDPLPDDVRLPVPFTDAGFDFHVGIFVALGLTIVLALLIRRTTWGFNLRMLGENSTAARRMGVRPVVVGGGALLLSGAIVGLAGGVLLTGSVFRVQDGFTNNIGWEGLLVAQIALKRPVPVAAVSLFWGALASGGGFLVSTGLARDLVDAVKGILVLALLVPPVYLQVRERRRELARAAADRT
jgi:simple sugar transport system permease protein